MSRIRSIHPKIFTDEAFMMASPHARVLIIGLWTEAWDDGAFEWKPIVIKARIFPADACDVAVLLAELESLNFIRKVERGGKQYGLIRNFRKFQRPKKPNRSGIVTPEDAHFVGPDYEHKPRDQGTLPPEEEPVPNRFGTGSEKPNQMEEGGGRKEEEGDSSSLRSELLAVRERESLPSAESPSLGVKKQIAKIYGDAGQLPPEMGRVDVWLSKGYAPEVIVSCVSGPLKRGKRPISLSYFDNAIAELASMPASTGPPINRNNEGVAARMLREIKEKANANATQ